MKSDYFQLQLVNFKVPSHIQTYGVVELPEIVQTPGAQFSGQPRKTKIFLLHIETAR